MQKNLVETPWYWELVCETPESRYELLINNLFENEAQGVEELKKTGKKMVFKLFYKSDYKDRPDELIRRLYANLFAGTQGLAVISCRKKGILDWQANWKLYFKPLEVGEDFLIRPPWEKAVPAKKEIVINPGQGFGTGYHESTYLALEMMEWLWRRTPFYQLIDAGTGSGILTIAALLLGTKKVTAFDIEENALAEVGKNIRLSNLDENRCTILSANPNEITEQADCVVANINDHILIKFSDDLCRLTDKSGYLILSGIISTEVEAVTACFTKNMNLIHQTQSADWFGLIFQQTT